MSRYAESPETEPNDDSEKAATVSLPATITGTIEKAGDIDLFRFEAKAGETLVLDTMAKRLGSGLIGALTVLDQNGRVLATDEDIEGNPDPVLSFTVPTDGTYLLRVSDKDYGGSGNHFYRIEAGTTPYLTAHFPLGVPPGQNRLDRA